MKLFISSDIHGYYDLWMKALEEKGFEKDNPNHAIAVTGDLLDRGEQPRECLEFVNSLPDNRKILIMGNHEELMDDMLRRGCAYTHDYSNGTFYTVMDFFGLKEKEMRHMDGIFFRFWEDPLWQNYYKSLVNYWENDKIVLVHGWIPVKSKFTYYAGDVVNPEYIEDWRTSNWKEARWYNGMDLWNKGIMVPDKTVFCGHWHSSWGHSYIHRKCKEWDDQYFMSEEKPDRKPRACFDPFMDVGIVAMDGCTAYSQQVNVKTVTIKKEDVENGKCGILYS